MPAIAPHNSSSLTTCQLPSLLAVHIAVHRQHLCMACLQLPLWALWQLTRRAVADWLQFAWLLLPTHVATKLWCTTLPLPLPAYTEGVTPSPSGGLQCGWGQVLPLFQGPAAGLAVSCT
jgi:hypothetical protein